MTLIPGTRAEISISYIFIIALYIYGIRRCLIGVGSITEVKQRRARFIIGWVTAWDCKVPYTVGHGAVMSCRGAQRTT